MIYSVRLSGGTFLPTVVALRQNWRATPTTGGNLFNFTFNYKPTTLVFLMFGGEGFPALQRAIPPVIYKTYNVIIYKTSIRITHPVSLFRFWREKAWGGLRVLVILPAFRHERFTPKDKWNYGKLVPSACPADGTFHVGRGYYPRRNLICRNVQITHLNQQTQPYLRII